MARKHVKVEPERWYYWCDKLGLLVWQDMPSGDKYIHGEQADIMRTAESGKEFETELASLIQGRQSSVYCDVGALQRRLGPMGHAANRRIHQKTGLDAAGG